MSETHSFGVTEKGIAMPQNREHFDRLLELAKNAHGSHAALSDFCRFPTDIGTQPVEPFHIPPSDLLQSETGLSSTHYIALRDAFVAASSDAHWRETYKDTDIGQDFMDRFGCYCLIGEGGPFTSDNMRAWLVYMPSHLHYTWHHHPAEENYLVIAGEAEFFRKGEPAATLCEGQISTHASNQPHAMTTHEHPVMAYVIWRNGFETPPVLATD